MGGWAKNNYGAVRFVFRRRVYCRNHNHGFSTEAARIFHFCSPFGPLAYRAELRRELLLHCDCLAKSPSTVQVLPACDAAPRLDKLRTSVDDLTGSVLDGVRRAHGVGTSSRIRYAAVFVLVNLAYIRFEWHALTFAPNERISARTRRFAKARSSLTLGTFIVAMLVSLKSPSLGFVLICCALLLYLRPEPPGVGSEDAGEVPSSRASPPRCQQESIVR